MIKTSQIFGLMLCVVKVSSEIPQVVVANKSLLREEPGFGYAYFVLHPNSKLDVENPCQYYVPSYKPCALDCTRNATCLSFNFGKKPIFFHQGQAQYLCELLATDKYNSSSKYQKQNPDFDHYSIPSNCSTSPCLNNFTCITNYTGDTYECLCPRPAFEGKHCKDVNECATGQDDCSPNATCDNTIGSYICTCNDGYSGNGITCLKDREWLKINNDPVCFGTRNSEFGRFYIAKSGAVTTVKLVHRSGYVACNSLQNAAKSYWGCGAFSFNPDYLMTILTDDQDQKVLPQDEFITDWSELRYSIPGYTSKSSELIFQNFATPRSVTAGQEYRIWYGQDLKELSEFNNVGTACMDVYMYGLF